MNEGKIRVNIENIIYFIDFKQNLKFKERDNEDFEGVENLSCTIFSFDDEKNKREGDSRDNAKSMVFPSGKVFLFGIKSSEEFEHIFWLLVKKLKENTTLKLNPNIDIEVENILVSANLRRYLSKGDDENFEVNLEKLALKEKENAEYDPKKFPGIFLRILPLGTAIVFRSGKVLVGDIKNIRDADIILERLIEKVRGL